jgi:predicted membrane channel-forming protein YqfA (hemolysin III family)
MDRLPMIPPQPSWRKPAGMFLILLLILVWAVIVVSASGLLTGLPWPVHAVYYLVAGILWILPLKPLLRWMETGKWRA